jgi:hypothetical protein
MPDLSPNLPQPWTIRLKHHKTTILIHCSPLTTLKTIKSTLLHSLAETHPSGTLNGHQIPKEVSEIRLAKAVDPLDIEQGWEEVSDGEDAESVAKGVGLKDGGVLAFRFVEDDEKKTEEDEDDEMELGNEGDNGQWDVVIPKFDDDFGVENEGDVGVRKEFRG